MSTGWQRSEWHLGCTTLLPGRVRLLEQSRFRSQHSDLFASSSRGETPAAWPRVKGNLALHPSSSSLFRGSQRQGGQERAVEASLTSLSSPGWVVTAFLATRPILCSQTAEPLWKACAFLAACERPWGEAAAAALRVSPAASPCTLSPPAICLHFPFPSSGGPEVHHRAHRQSGHPPGGRHAGLASQEIPCGPGEGKRPSPSPPREGRADPLPPALGSPRGQ